MTEPNTNEKYETLSAPRDNRLGSFFLRANEVWDDQYIGKAVLDGCIVVRCEYMAHLDGFEYIALHEQFADVSFGHLPPRYDAQLTRDAEGNITSRTWVRLAK